MRLRSAELSGGVRRGLLDLWSSARLFEAAICAFALVAACSQPPPPKMCVGGIILADGTCVAKCDPSKCIANNTCVGNACVLKCARHDDCTATQRCVPANEDGTDAGILICKDADLKQNGKPCPNGDECTFPAICRSSGMGDATAYCVSPCSGDSDCPGGYECGTMRDPHVICGTMKGNNNFCGLSFDPCLESSAIAADPTLLEGKRCLERKVCLKKNRCASCTGDVDCFNPGAKCVQIGPDTRCVDPCSKNTDCEASDNCTDGFCKPRFGNCTAPDAGFCTPCRYDRDCEPNFECSGLHGTERSCVDVTFGTSCTTDNDCPVAPSGLHGTCLGPNQNVDPTDSVYHRCYVPQDVNEAFTCYPAH